MSCLIPSKGRIGRNIQNLKTFAVRNGLIYSFETCKRKCLTGGVGIAAMITSLSGCLIDRAKKVSCENSNVIRNLEQIVKQRSYFYYNANKNFFSKGYTPDMRLDWSGVKFYPEKPTYSKLDDGVNGYRTTSRTVFENQSKTDQEHKLKSERQTSSVYESSLTEGYTIGPNIGLSLPVPVDIGISAMFSLQRVTGNIDEEKNSWLVEDFIKVPRKSIIVVSMVLHEKEIEYSFTTRIGVEGTVVVSYYDQKGIEVSKYRIPMRAIIREEFPERMRQEKDNITFITITGRCKIKHKFVKTVITNQEQSCTIL